ncbi:hypothetical protein ACQP1S_30600 [Micromonospora matsumotoense]|uniref:hypothetical protein n=1 Tax=Micromonospora matsumotoense TaxID=121616 RepID=UPI003D928684
MPVLLCLVGLGPVAQASEAVPDPDEGSIGIQLLEAPVSRRADPRALRYIVDHLPPGSVIKRQMRVRNTSDEQQRIDLYPSAATVEGQKFTFGEGRTANELTSWISLDRHQLTLDPGDSARFTGTIAVPANASSGERYAVVWASATSKPTASGNVTQVHRVGVRVYLSVGAGGEPPSDFRIGEFVPARDPDGVPSVAIGVDNTGQRALDLTGKVNLTEGPGGMEAGPFDIVEGTTLSPGDSGGVVVRLPKELPNGPWKIVADLESGMVKRSVTRSIEFPDRGKVGKPGTILSGWMPLWSIAGALVVVLLILAALIMKRRSRQPAAVG